MKAKVVYRKFPEGDIIALFPQEPYDRTGYDCMSYQHVGQHGAADPLLTHGTQPASPTEYAPLHRELTSLGYDLVVGNRVTSYDNALRMAEARKSRIAPPVI